MAELLGLESGWAANLGLQERDILGQVAKCLTTGALKEEREAHRRRADPRGEQEYNASASTARPA